MSNWTLARCRENVERHGWNATGTVTADEVAYVYTTGLTTHLGCPELVIAGLDPHTGHDLLKAAVAKAEAGAALEPGVLYEGMAEGFVVRFRDVFRPACRLSFALTNGFYGKSVAFRQLLWPDSSGRFPGEPGCGEWIASVQDIGGVGQHG
jgi:hypothetical protein